MIYNIHHEDAKSDKKTAKKYTATQILPLRILEPIQLSVHHPQQQHHHHHHRRSMIVMMTAVLLVLIHTATNLCMYFDISIILSDANLPTNSFADNEQQRRITIRPPMEVEKKSLQLPQAGSSTTLPKKDYITSQNAHYAEVAPNDSSSIKNEAGADNKKVAAKITNTYDTSNSNRIRLVDADLILDPIRSAGGTMYSICRADRSGSVILNMLYAHAFAYANNLTYGGACCVSNGLPKLDTVLLIKDLKWDSLIPFACPPDVDPKQYNILHPNATEIHPSILNGDVYSLNGEHALSSSKWRKYVQDSMKQSIQSQKPERITDLDGYTSIEQDDDSLLYYNIAVHIRRGDVTPCRYVKRYLPNAHYISLIDQYTPSATTLNGRTVKVTIYSESNSFEPFDQFIQRNYTMKLDGNNLADVWRAISTADVAILSRSTFSIVPAIMNQNIVVATDFFDIFNVYAMKEVWEFASNELIKNTTANIRILRNRSCTNHQ